MALKAARIAEVSRKIERFIKTYVKSSSANGLVVGLSGGLDSSVVVTIASNAVGPAKVLGLAMPASATPDRDVTDAINLAESLGITYRVIKIDPIIETFSQALPDHKRAKGNLAARIRMSILYYFAATEGYLVAGTSDKSERLIGFYTKFGDGAADIMPIAGLYKTEVRQLASYLKLPASIVEKKSSPRLWEGHLAEEEIGLSYDRIDPILRLLVDKKKTPKAIAKTLRVPLSEVMKVKEMVDKSAHKRKPAPFPRI